MMARDDDMPDAGWWGTAIGVLLVALALVMQWGF